MKKEEMVKLLVDAGFEASMEMKKEELEKMVEENSEFLEMENTSEENTYYVKLAKRHPMKKMFLGKNIITLKEEKFILSEDEVKELNSKGGKHWFTYRVGK